MRKLSVVLLILILCASFLFAQNQNMQKIYGTSCSEYQAIKSLYISQGHSLPSTSGPWSADELYKMLEVLDVTSLSTAEKNTYDTVLASITKDPKTNIGKINFNLNGHLNFELYAHTNTDGYERTTVQGIKEKAFQGMDGWIYSPRDQKTFANLELETFAYNNFYANFQLDLANSWHAGKNYTKELGYKNFHTSIIAIKNMELEMALFDANWPYRSFLSIGGDGWNVQLGRDRISWGNGETGNLAISDNMPWHNFVKATTYSQHFKYSFLTSFFPHALDYWKGGSWHAYSNSYKEVIQGTRMYIAHRVEGRFFKDKLNISATEGLMYMSEENAIDMRALNPLNFNHNNYISRNSNSTLTFEADWAVTKGLNIYGQFIFDEAAFPGVEKGPSPTNKEPPSATGLIVGAKLSLPVGNGMLVSTAEFALTDPYLYLRGGTETSPYGIDYVVAIRDWSTSVTDVTYNEYFLGYTYGCDALVGQIKSTWTRSDLRLSAEGSFLFMAHGTHDAWTKRTWIGGTQENYDANHASPTTKHTSENVKYSNAQTVRNSVEYTSIVGIKATYYFTPKRVLTLQSNYIDIRNYKNEGGINESDFQFVVSYTLQF